VFVLPPARLRGAWVRKAQECVGPAPATGAEDRKGAAARRPDDPRPTGHGARQGQSRSPGGLASPYYGGMAEGGYRLHPNPSAREFRHVARQIGLGPDHGRLWALGKWEQRIARKVVRRLKASFADRNAEPS
jgi:hypothetical protein